MTTTNSRLDNLYRFHGNCHYKQSITTPLKNTRRQLASPTTDVISVVLAKIDTRQSLSDSTSSDSLSKAWPEQSSVELFLPLTI